MTIGVLYDSFSDNVGDIAMLQASRQLLADNGIADVEAVNLFATRDQQFSSIIVGGGELIRPVGDHFYDKFRAPEANVLMAVGVWPDADSLEYLSSYEYVSARTSAETNTLRDAGIDAHTMPCPTMALGFDEPGIDLPDNGELIGVHVVPAALKAVPSLVDRINDLSGHKVLIPFTRYLNDYSFMSALPIGDSTRTWVPGDLTPTQLRGLVKELNLVVASSLHLTLFAISAGVPFVAHAQPKVRSYLEDRGLEELLFDDDASLLAALEAAPEMVHTITAVAESDRDAVSLAYRNLAQYLKDNAERTITVPPMFDDPNAARHRLLNEQIDQVIGGRDLLLHDLYYAQSDRANLRRELDAHIDMVVQLRHDIEDLRRHNPILHVATKVRNAMRRGQG